MELLFGKPPKMHRDVKSGQLPKTSFDTSDLNLGESIKRVLALPAVASKNFLITIGDRTITGLVHRDQMVGPWQVPVADAAVTATAYCRYTGEAMAMGGAGGPIFDAAASGRMAIAESVTNIACASIEKIGDIKLSANWMVAAGHCSEDQKLFETVRAVAMDLCPQLGICIPVGKDSMSMRTVWNDDGHEKSNTAPLSLIVSAFSPVDDIRKTLTPQLQTGEGETSLLLIDLGRGKNRLAGSALGQVYSRMQGTAPDLDAPSDWLDYSISSTIAKQNLITAYHDRSDGGLFTTLAEMAFAGHCGVDVQLEPIAIEDTVLAALFNEELGAVIQVYDEEADFIIQSLQKSVGPVISLIGDATMQESLVSRLARIFYSPRAG